MHFGHYISGSAHAGILSWLLVGSWFVPPEPAPFESVSVAMISSAEFAAIIMSDESPETAQFTSEVVAPSEQEELDLQMPREIQSLSQAAEVDMISIEEANRISLLHTVPLPAAAVPLALSLGRVLAEDVLAREVRMSRCETWRPECGAHEMLTCASRSPFPRCRR